MMTAEEKEEQSLWSSPAWYEEGEYHTGETVRDGTRIYRCKEDHYAAAENRPGFSLYWEDVTPALRSRYAVVTKELPE